MSCEFLSGHFHFHKMKKNQEVEKRKQRECMHGIALRNCTISFMTRPRRNTYKNDTSIMQKKKYELGYNKDVAEKTLPRTI